MKIPQDTRSSGKIECIYVHLSLFCFLSFKTKFLPSLERTLSQKCGESFGFGCKCTVLRELHWEHMARSSRVKVADEQPSGCSAFPRSLTTMRAGWFHWIAFLSEADNHVRATPAMLMGSKLWIGLSKEAARSISSTKQGMWSSNCPGNNIILNYPVNETMEGTSFASLKETCGPAGIIWKGWTLKNILQLIWESKLVLGWPSSLSS